MATRRPGTDNPPVNDHAAQPDFSVKPTITGEKVTLRPFRPAEDLPAIREMLRDPDVIRLTGSAHTSEPEPWDEAEEERVRQWYATRNEQPDRLDLAIVDRATGGFVGETALNQWDAGNRTCNFRIIVAAPGRDRGLGTEATRLTVGHGFERLGLHRIELGVFAFNPRARRAYEKVGFVAEGVRREALRFDGEWIDDVQMAILDHEWARHRGHPDS